MIVVLRSTFDASNAKAWGEYALEETKALEVWRSEAFADRTRAIAEMRATAAIADPRAHPLWHIVYSYAPDEPIVLDAARANLERFHEALTGDYQDRTGRRPTLLWMAAPHGDAHCRHVHEMLLTIDADTGERLVRSGQNVRLFHDFSRAHTVPPLLARLEPRNAVVGRARDGEIWNGQVSFARWLRELVIDSSDWADHDGRLCAFGLVRADRRATYVYVDKMTSKPVVVAAGAVLTAEEQRALGPRPAFVQRGPQVYASYRARAISAELIEPTLPGGVAAFDRWRSLRDAGYRVGRLGEFARRNDDPPMMKNDDPRSRRAAGRSTVGRRGRPLLVVTSAGRALQGAPVASGRRFYRALDGTMSARVDAIDKLDLTRAHRLLVEDTGEHPRRFVADIENRVISFVAEDHAMNKKSVGAAELSKILASRLSADRDLVRRAASDDPRIEAAQQNVTQIDAILPRLAMAPSDQQFTVRIREGNQAEIDAAYLADLEALLPPVERTIATDPKPQRLTANELAEALLERRLEALETIRDTPSEQSAAHAEMSIRYIDKMLPLLASAPAGQTFEVSIDENGRFDLKADLLERLSESVALMETPGNEARTVSALVGTTWKSLYNVLPQTIGRNATYGAFAAESGVRAGGIFDVAAGGLRYLGTPRDLGFDNLDLTELEMKMGPLVAPGHPESAMTLAERGPNAAVLEADLVEQFQQAYEARDQQRDVRVAEGALHVGEVAFAQNSIGAASAGARTNSLGSPDALVVDRDEHPLVARLKAEYPGWLLQQGEMEPVTEQIIERYESARARAFRKLDLLRDQGDEREGKPLKLRSEELDALKSLALLQEETTISLGLAQSHQFLRPTLRRFVEVYNGIDDGERAQAMQLLKDDVDMEQTEELFRYDTSLRAAINTKVEGINDGRLAYVQADRPERTRFYEQDDRYYMRRMPSGDDIDVALRMAEARWGSVDITGDDKFVERALRRAAELGIDVSTERHQKRLGELRKEIAGQRALDVTREQPNVSLPIWAQPIASEVKRSGEGERAVRAYEDARLAELVKKSVFGQGALAVTNARDLDAKSRTEDGVIDGTLLGAVHTASRTIALVGVPDPDRDVRRVVFTDLPESADARKVEAFRDRQVSVQVDEKGDAELYFGVLGAERRARSESSMSR